MSLVYPREGNRDSLVPKGCTYLGRVPRKENDNVFGSAMSFTTTETKEDVLWIAGARTHNLAGIEVAIPHGRLTVITGPSGSGKSSLAFHTLYAEGYRRYVETFSPYTRQFLERLPKPDLDKIEGVIPAIAVEQGKIVKSSRSTVATLTQILDLLKILFSRLGVAFCPRCSQLLRPKGPREITEELLACGKSEEAIVLFPMTLPKDSVWGEVFTFLQAQGFVRIWWQNRLWRVDETPPEGDPPLELWIVADRFLVKESLRSRISDSLERALELGKGRVDVLLREGECPWRHQRFASRWVCATCGYDQLPEPQPSLFTPHHPLGACSRCQGFGRTVDWDWAKVVPDPSLSLRRGAVAPLRSSRASGWWNKMLAACRKRGIPIHVPVGELGEKEKAFIWEGDEAFPSEEKTGWRGVLGFFEFLATKSYKPHIRIFLSKYRSYTPCPACQGSGLNERACQFRIAFGGDRWLTLADTLALTAAEATKLFQALSIPSWDRVSEELRTALVRRLEALVEVGLGYLALSRPSRTLSGGETQRVHLISCLGSGLVHTLFVLDEPTVGLHPRDSARLVGALEKLRDGGNTVVVVEHDEAIIRRADHIVELGPGRGSGGGRVVFSGSPAELLRHPSSLTGAYLSGRSQVARHGVREPKPGFWLKLSGIRAHNLSGIDVSLPLGVLVCLVGVSGSGKSTLLEQGIIAGLSQKLSLSVDIERQGSVEAVEGWEHIRDVIFVDPAPPSRTPRSVVASYVGVLDPLRELFARTEEAQLKDLRAVDFSFNAGKGRCPRCKGAGVEEVPMQFLADVFLPCSACDGRRFQEPVLEVRYHGRTILDVLDCTAEDALDFFEGVGKRAAEPEKRWNLRICEGLELLRSVGLGYLKLGQRLSELSGGESQRIKLAAHLMQGLGQERRVPNRSQTTLLLMDEPSVGLHPDDLQALVATLDRLLNLGYSIVIIEHNLDLIRCADWLVELGPGGGPEGGKVIASGPPGEVARQQGSPTGELLQRKWQERGESLASPPAVWGSPRRPLPSGVISIRNATHHNLQSVSLDIPWGRWTAFSGLSGSGKSTLAFELLFAEGQRRYLECVSPYVRQFVEQLERPEVESVTGVPPSVAVEQRASLAGPKSTVGTVTEIYPFLRLLYAKLGLPHDPKTGERAQKQTLEEIARKIDQLLLRTQRLWVLAPLVRGRKGSYARLGLWAQKKGYPYLWVDGRMIASDSYQPLARFREHTIHVVLGELNASGSPEKMRVLVQEGLSLGKGSVYTLDSRGKLVLYSVHFHCPSTGSSFEELDPRLFSFHSPHGWCPACRGFGVELLGRQEDRLEGFGEQGLEGVPQTGSGSALCECCGGQRLNELARRVTLPLGAWLHPDGPTLPELCRLTIRELVRYWDSIKLEGTLALIASEIHQQVRQRLAFLEGVGLGYLTLDRPMGTLSAGESQRIRLAAQLGSPLQGVLYVLDEPTIGLHPRECQGLLDAVEKLKARRNTIVMVEHDEEALRRADWIVELGPGAGKGGGKIVAEGKWDELIEKDCATARAFRQTRRHPLRGARRPCPGEQGWLRVEGACVHNLKDLVVEIPLGRLVVICGPSGAGKSTLLQHVVFPAVCGSEPGRKNRPKGRAQEGSGWKRVEGAERIGGVRLVDSEPIGKTPRSTPATYIGLMDALREFFASLPLARQRGYGPGRFSYNNREGQCPQCGGCGMLRVQLPLLSPTTLRCQGCKGMRFNPQTLEVQYRGRNLAQVLALTAEEALEFFSGLPRIERKLRLLCDVGLGYLPLGQPSPTLSGGEAQRIKLVAELEAWSVAFRMGRSRKGLLPYLYLLEEPTIGLHLEDVTKLLATLQALVDQGHTVVVVEHHPEVIAEADWVIELGPGAAEEGGWIVASGPPETIVTVPGSPTGPYLEAVLQEASQ